MADVLPAAIQAFVDATNAGDREGFVAVFTEDAYLNDWGREFHGHDGVASWDSTDNIGVNSHFEVRGVEKRGDEFVVRLVVSGDGFNGVGTLTFRLAGDKIASLVIS